MGRWLMLTGVNHTSHESTNGTQYKLTYSYQVVNIEQGLREFLLPRHYLHYGKDNNLNKLIVPPSKPLGITSISNPNRRDVQPNAAPKPLTLSVHKLLIYGVLLACTLISLFVLLMGLPFSHSANPFKDALKVLKNTQNGVENSLKILHGAFNATANKTVFVDNLDDFFQRHPQFKPLQKEIEQFFAYSNQVFFAPRSSAENMSDAEIIALAKRCRKVEQGV